MRVRRLQRPSAMSPISNALDTALEPTHVLRLLPEEAREAVAFRNAAELFRLSVPVTA